MSKTMVKIKSGERKTMDLNTQAFTLSNSYIMVYQDTTRIMKKLIVHKQKDKNK